MFDGSRRLVIGAGLSGFLTRVSLQVVHQPLELAGGEGLAASSTRFPFLSISHTFELYGRP